jgi:hypothetical protein
MKIFLVITVFLIYAYYITILQPLSRVKSSRNEKYKTKKLNTFHCYYQLSIDKTHVSSTKKAIKFSLLIIFCNYADIRYVI